MIKLLVLFLIISSCSYYASEKNFDALSLNMNKQEAMNVMDCSGIARGSIINKFGQVVEVREYDVTRFRPFVGTTIDTYWLFFCDGKLVQWGKAGDWAEAQRLIYDVNFKFAMKN